MIPRIRRVLISLAFAPCVSAAPTVQQSDLPLVESLPAPCNFGPTQIHRTLCALVHSIPEIADEAILFSPAYTVNVGVSLLVGADHITNKFHTEVDRLYDGCMY